MPTTPNFSLPFPSLSDPPNVPADLEALAEAVDAEMSKGGSYGSIVFAGVTGLSGVGRLSSVESSSTQGVITYDGAGRLVLPAGVYWVTGTVAVGTGPAWVRSWPREDTPGASVRGAIAAVTTAGGGSIGNGLVVAVSTISIGLWHELPAGSHQVAGGGQTYLDVVRAGPYLP